SSPSDLRARASRPARAANRRAPGSAARSPTVFGQPWRAMPRDGRGAAPLEPGGSGWKGIVMTLRTVLASSALIALVLLPTIASAEPACDAHSLSGGYGFHLTGTNLARSALYAIAGRIEADGQGGFVGSATHSAQGAIARIKFTGTYTVNADCTGTSTMKF